MAGSVPVLFDNTASKDTSSGKPVIGEPGAALPALSPASTGNTV
jgi:hypothetical protein